MCFSTEVSFTASAGLAVIGIKTILVNNKKTRLLSYMPIIFSIHQFTEGMNWLFLSEGQSFIKTFFVHLYAYIQYVLWPIYIPLACYFLEIDNRKKRKLFHGVFVALGVGYAASWASSMIQGDVIVRQICNPDCAGLIYLINFPSSLHLWKLIYLTIITLPALISSYKSVKLFGFLTALAWLGSNVYFIRSFGSTWCFFAAILSCIVLISMKEQKAFELKKQNILK
jgi:hypothetical protein